MKEDFYDSSSDTENNNENIYGLMMKSNKELEEYAENNPERLIDHEDLSNNSRPLIRRVFGRMDAGSLRGSIFAMSSLALGTGCLALPQVFEDMSMVLAIIMIFLGGSAAYWCLSILIIAGQKVQIYDYSRLVKHLFGTALGKTLDIVIMIFIFGIMIAYQVISI